MTSSKGMPFSASCILTFLAYGLGVALIRRYMTTYFLAGLKALMMNGFRHVRGQKPTITILPGARRSQMRA